MITNTERASRARTALIDYAVGLETEIIDMLTDIKHLCQQDDIDFAKCLRLAELHFNVEVSEEA